jgi:hypothetical protein
MATLNSKLVIAVLAGLGFPACGKLVGVDTSGPPLAQIHFLVTGQALVPGADGGDSDALALSDADAGEQDASAEQADAGTQAPHLRVALVWGAQVLPEPFCVRPPASMAPVHLDPSWRPPSRDRVVAAGCPDIFRFVPNLSGPDVAVEPGVPGTIDLINLPNASVMVGDLTARIAYASLVVYDDRDGNGILDFRHPRQGNSHHDEEHYDPGTPETRDIPYGASFIDMTQPDQRVAYREGGFDQTVAFYPRYGCESYPPLPGFSILSADGFSIVLDGVAHSVSGLSQSALATAAVLGQLGETTCGVAKLDEAVVTIPLQLEPDRAQPWPPPDTLRELACTVNNADGNTRYLEPVGIPDFAYVDWACVGFPHLPGDDAGVTSGQQLVVASSPNEPCQYVYHYILRGCDTGPNCSSGGWDYTTPQNPPPSWWPCGATTP